jgi:hypothetical protein
LYEHETAKQILSSHYSGLLGQETRTQKISPQVSMLTENKQYSKIMFSLVEQKKIKIELKIYVVENARHDI